MNRVQFEASQVMISEAQSNDIYMTVLIRMFSTRPNRNGYAVSEAFMDNIVANVAKYTCLPQCADAQRLRSGTTSKLTHMLNDGEFQSEQIGSFFSFAKASDEFGVSLIGEARIPKRSAQLCETILRMYEAGTLTFSFEIMATTVVEQDGVMVIDAAEGNELIGMAIVSVPAYPEATALQLVAERQEDYEMDETVKKLAEAEARLKLAEEKMMDDEEKLRQKDDALEETTEKQKQQEAELEAAQEQLAEKGARIAELEAQVSQLEPFKAEVEKLKAEKEAAELAAKQQELTAFAEAQGLDVKAENVASAIAELNYAALIAEANKVKRNDVKPTVAAYALTSGLTVKGEYGDLLEKA